jgi:microcystin-dependent protein
MASPYIGDIRMFGGNFAPVGYFFCEGQLLSIADYDALFSLIGTTYGGDGMTTFALPDLRGRIPIHSGQGPGLQAYTQGQASGAEQVTLTVPQVAAHSHNLMATSAAGTSSTPGNNMLATASGAQVYETIPQPQPLLPASITPTGGSQPHDNMAPFLCVNFIIAVEGVYPSRP